MANTNEVHIKGWMPFDISQHEAARSWLGIMNGPSYGLKIRYRGAGSGPENDHGGHTTYYRFEIRGSEALWTTEGRRSVKDLVESLLAGGALIEEAQAMDLEYDPDHRDWYDLLQHFPDREQVEVTPGDPLLRILFPPAEEPS